jgi:hypothetical protein
MRWDLINAWPPVITGMEISFLGYYLVAAASIRLGRVP